jgi:hypothetical protein
MNEDNSLSRLKFTENTWFPASVIASPPITGISNMFATAPYVAPTVIYLYYLLNHRPLQLIINEGPGVSISALSSPSELPDAIQAPPLIAASSRVQGTWIQPQRSIFYVWKVNGTMGEGEVQGSEVVNATVPWGYEEDWLVDSWEV